MLAFALVLACTMSAMGQPSGKGDTRKEYFTDEPDDRNQHERDKEIVDRATRLAPLVQRSRSNMEGIVNAMADDASKKMKTIDTRGARNETTAGGSSGSTGRGIAVCHLAIGPIGGPGPVVASQVQHFVQALEVDEYPIANDSEVSITIGRKGLIQRMEENATLVGVISGPPSLNQRPEPEALLRPRKNQEPEPEASQKPEEKETEEGSKSEQEKKLKRAIESGDVPSFFDGGSNPKNI